MLLAFVATAALIPFAAAAVIGDFAAAAVAHAFAAVAACAAMMSFHGMAYCQNQKAENDEANDVVYHCYLLFFN